MLQSTSALSGRLRAIRRRIDEQWGLSAPTSDLSVRLTLVRGSRDRVPGHRIGIQQARVRAGRAPSVWSAEASWTVLDPVGCLAGELALPAVVWAAPAVLDLEVSLGLESVGSPIPVATPAVRVPLPRGLRPRPGRSSHLFFWNGRPCDIEVLLSTVVEDGDVRATVEDVLVFL